MEIPANTDIEIQRPERGDVMRRLALLVLFFIGTSLSAQEMPKAKPPQLPFQVVDNFFKIPKGMFMAEAVGVAINSKGHIFILNRGNYPLLEFDQEGSFLTSYGEGSPVFHVPHSIRFDSEDNLWLVGAADNMVVKFDRTLRVIQALGRRSSDLGWVYMTHGIERAIPPPADFYQPTDTAIGPDGNTYVTDGYGNSRVAKFTKEGNLIKYWGDRGTRPRNGNEAENTGRQHSSAALEGIDDTSVHERCHANPRLPAEVNAATPEPLLRPERQPWAVGSETHLPLLPQPRAPALECAVWHRAVSDSFQQTANLHGILT